MNNIDRRKFLKVTGSLAIGGAFLTVVGNSLLKMFTRPESLFHDTKRDKGFELMAEDEDFVSPYRRTFGFVAPDEISALDVDGGSIFIATPNNIIIYGLSGEVQTQFAVKEGVRDLKVYKGKIFALYATKVEVYDRQGNMKQDWEACSDNSDYCSFAVCEDGVFVTDAANKNICKYNLDGSLSKFINSPKGFVVPSYCFAITAMDGKIICSNPGKHIVEEYTTDGEFITSFGKSGSGEGEFCGCCNPAIIAPANGGEILTSEKGIPRVSCYDLNGKFRSILLDSKALGGGHKAYNVRVMKDKLIVTGGNKISIFQYNKNQSQETACGQCDKDCPLKI